MCKISERSAGLPNPGDNATTPGACFAVCFVAKTTIGIGLGFAGAGLGNAWGGINGARFAGAVNSQEMTVVGELMGYEYCYRECKVEKPCLTSDDQISNITAP